MHEYGLIQGLKNGSGQAFEELVNLFKDRIYNTVLGFAQDHHDAEEITQDVFVSVYKNIEQFRGESEIATWMYRIAVTQSLDHLRKKKRRLKWRLQKKETENEKTDFNHPGIVTEQKENAALLFKAIKELPEQQQAAFLLLKLEGLSQQQTAIVLKTSVSAVESLLHRAKINLRKLLEEKIKKEGK